MRQLDHPNIVKLIDFSESKQYYFIILELAPGGELFHQIVRLTYFSEDLSKHVITQVAEALLYLHEEKGVVHRYVRNMHLAEVVQTNCMQGHQTRKSALLTNSIRSCKEPQTTRARR